MSLILYRLPPFVYNKIHPGDTPHVRLASPDVLLLVHGRNPARGRAVAEVIEAAGGSATFYEADFASLLGSDGITSYCFARIVGGPNGTSRSSSALPSFMRKLVMKPSGKPSG